MTDSTPDGLPVISNETYRSLISIVERELRSVSSETDDVKHFRAENPLLYDMFKQLLQEYGEGDYCDGAAFGMYITYELLRRQSAANKLKNELR